MKFGLDFSLRGRLVNFVAQDFFQQAVLPAVNRLDNFHGLAAQFHGKLFPKVCIQLFERVEVSLQRGLTEIFPSQRRRVFAPRDFSRNPAYAADCQRQRIVSYRVVFLFYRGKGVAVQDGNNLPDDLLRPFTFVVFAYRCGVDLFDNGRGERINTCGGNFDVDDFFARGLDDNAADGNLFLKLFERRGILQFIAECFFNVRHDVFGSIFEFGICRHKNPSVHVTDKRTSTKNFAHCKICRMNYQA